MSACFVTLNYKLWAIAPPSGPDLDRLALAPSLALNIGGIAIFVIVCRFVAERFRKTYSSTGS